MSAPPTARGQKISKDRLVSDLRAMGVQRGDHVAVGLSYKSIGSVEGGPETLIDALVDTVGPEGTVMMNTFTEFFYTTEVARGWVDYVFDPDSTRVNTGIVPETFRKRPESIRSRHPTNSVAAAGKHAAYLTRDHDERAEAYLPYKRLAEINGKYVAVGIGERLVGLRHQAQQAAGLLHVVPWVRVVRFKSHDGQTKLFRLRDRGGCVTRLVDLVQDLREHGLVRDGMIGEASAILVPAQESLEVMTSALTDHPERNLCDSLVCYWCRELERRMDLFAAIENPKSFQRHGLAVHVLALINRLREADSPLVARAKGLIKKHRR